MRKLFGNAVLGCAMLVQHGRGASAADIPGSKDPSFLKRYQGSSIIASVTSSYDQYLVAVPDPKKPPSGYQFTPVEGQITRIVYQTGPGHTVLELLRNYESAIHDAGFTRNLELTEKQADPRDFGGDAYAQTWQPAEDFNWTNLGRSGIKQMGYVSARGTRDGKDITLAVLIINYSHDVDIVYQGQKRHFDPTQITVVVDVVTAKAADIKMVVVKAADMADALATKGVIDLYGVYFDTDKTEVKPESGATLDEVATLLKIDRSLRLELSGHTDNTGDKGHNLKLSQARAQAVVQILVAKYRIDSKRLTGKGYGDTKPIVPNDTEANKARNRRVELRKL